MDNEVIGTGITMEQMEFLLNTMLKNSGISLRAPGQEEDTPNVPRPEDVDTGDRKKLLKGIKQVTFEEYENITEEERRQYMFFVRESADAAFGFIALGNLKYTMVPEDIRGIDCGYFDEGGEEDERYKTPLTFNIITDGTISWDICGTTWVKTIDYKINDGEWQSITAGPSSFIDVVAGDKVSFRGTNDAYAKTNKLYSGFGGAGTATFSIYGNIMSLLYGDDFIGHDNLTSVYTFCCLFDGSNVVSAKDLVLPATAMTSNCYRALFANCSLLTEGPEILPATVLADNCYRYMFNVDVLLTKAPTLPAVNLVSNCYYGLFSECASLNYIKCLATDISATSCTTSWVNGVASQGTFVKNANMLNWSSGTNGVPRNWVVENALRGQNSAPVEFQPAEGGDETSNGD